MASDMAVFMSLSEFADTAIYDDGTTTVSIPVILDSYDLGTKAGRLDVPATHGTILVKKSDVPTPAYRQTFTVSGVEWEINSGPNNSFVVGEDSDTWLLRVQKGERFAKWRK